MKKAPLKQVKGVKTALVTGASHGIGRAVSLALGRSGFEVLLCARNEADLTRSAARITQEGHSAAVVAADLATQAGRQLVTVSVADRWPHLNVFVHCASARADPEVDATLSGTSPEAIDEIVATTVTGTVHLLRLLQPRLEAGKPSNAILITSDWALRGSHGPPVFSAAKAAVVQLAHTIRRDFARHGIAVTTICPGDVASFDKTWTTPKWSLDDSVHAVRSELGETRIALADVVEAVTFAISRKLARVEEIYLAPLSGDYDY